MDGLSPDWNGILAPNPFHPGAVFTNDGNGSARARSLLDLGPALVHVLRLIPLKSR